MSSLLYGSLTRQRLETPVDQTLVTASVAEGATTVPTPKEKVKSWQDALAALVPAEVLALHAVALSYGTTTEGSGSSAVTSITHPDEMTAVYIALMVLAFALYIVGAKSFKNYQWLRALIPVLAFVLWTMIQPSTAFDALGFDLSSFARTMIATIGAVVLGGISALLAAQADKTAP